MSIVGKGMPEAAFVENIMEEFGKAKLIVAQGGISTITEALVLGKPLVVMCDEDAEKTNNAKYVERIGCAVTLDCEETRTEKIKSAMQKALSLNVMPLPVDGMAAHKIAFRICNAGELFKVKTKILTLFLMSELEVAK